MQILAFIQADPVEVMEEIERLQNKMSQDYNGVSGYLMKNIHDWYSENKLTLNIDKINVILFSISKNAQQSCPEIYSIFPTQGI